jgi:hypothetical protein
MCSIMDLALLARTSTYIKTSPQRLTADLLCTCSWALNANEYFPCPHVSVLLTPSS